MTFVQDVNNLRRAIGKDSEVEAKLGTYSGSRFQSSVPRRPWYGLLSRLKSGEITTFPNLVYQGVEISRVELYNDNIRHITVLSPYPNSSLNDVWQKKSTKADVNNKTYDIRISVNEEKDIPPPTTLLELRMTRERTRDTFFIDGARIDMTRVMTISDRESKPTYEIELELVDIDLNTFAQYIEMLYMAFRDTYLIYTSFERMRVLNMINEVLGTRDFLVQARNIKRSDIVYGGIVGNKNNSYYFTFKADGHRKLLVIAYDGIWLCYPPYEFNLIYRLRPGMLRERNNFIFDGEVLKEDKIRYRYFAFDTIVMRGSSDIQEKNYKQRLSIASKFCIDSARLYLQVENGKLFSLEIKETYLLDNPDTFFDDLAILIEKKKTLDYKQDGLMVIPSGKYNYHSDKLPMNKRILTLVPDICKIKDVKDITIDFEFIRDANGGVILRVYDDRTKKNVPFTGSIFKRLTPDMIVTDHPETNGIDSGTIVEYEYNFETNMLQPKKVRIEKSGPNSLQVAEANWGDIMSPLTDDDLSGKTNTLAYAYQNRIKKGLIELIPRGSTVLGIGEGRGGDHRKYAANKISVIAVEPNVENAEEMIRRNDQLKVVIDLLITGGEDFATIRRSVIENTISGKVDAVLCMLSLSFFWRDAATLDALVTTISENLKDGGKFIFLTIDGNSLEQIFEPSFNTQVNDPRLVDGILTLANAQFYLHEREEGKGRAVSVYLPGTIVEEQEETLVKMNELTKRLKKNNIHLTEFHRAEHERLLPRDSKVFSSLYSYGYYTKEAKETFQAKEDVRRPVWDRMGRNDIPATTRRTIALKK